MTKPDDITRDQETGGVNEEDQPQIFSVDKDLNNGWTFSRRTFVVASAAAVAATAASVAFGSDKQARQPKQGAEIIEEKNRTLLLTTLAMTAVQPAQAFVQTWTLTNNSETTPLTGARLQLSGHNLSAKSELVAIPNIAPGDSMDVPVDMVAPDIAGIYPCRWELQLADQTLPVAVGMFTVLNGCLAESAHPYESDTSEQWTVLNPDENAQQTRLHFSRLEIESGYDYLRLMDASDTVHQEISGMYPTGLWSDTIPGREVRLHLETDSTVVEWGFCVDKAESARLIYLPMVFHRPTPTATATPTATPTRTPTPTPTCDCDGHCTCNAVCSCDGYCTCNTVCTCDTVCTCEGDHYWYPN